MWGGIEEKDDNMILSQYRSRIWDKPFRSEYIAYQRQHYWGCSIMILERNKLIDEKEALKLMRMIYSDSSEMCELAETTADEMAKKLKGYDGYLKK